MRREHLEDGDHARHPRDPRNHPNYRARGSKVWLLVTYQAIATAAGVTVAAAKRAAYEGRLDVRDLASVADWCIQSMTKAQRRRAKKRAG